MSKRKLVIAAGALVLVGGAAAIAAVGERKGHFGHRGHMDGSYDLVQVGERGWGERGRGHHGAGEGHWGHHFGSGGMEGRRGRDPDMRRGWLSRSLTADEFDARVRERFGRLDKNGDGVADAAEIEAGIGRIGERRRGMRERMHERFAARLDSDRDGKVTRQEMLDRVRKQFSRMDLDGDGRITDADLPPMMRGRDVLKGEAGVMARGRGMARGLGRLRAADANADGIVTLDEVLAAAGRRFDLADRNKDGTHDKADRDALDKEMTAYRVQRFVHLNGGKDGRVTREQFSAAAKERFAERDLNRDGRLDRDDSWRGRGRGRGDGSGPDGSGMRDRGPAR
jgi:Ca2+-binding EF-hand superfamily protein